MDNSKIWYVTGASQGWGLIPGGAAEYLKMPATTLHSKVKKLGLKKYTFTDGR
jgi:hypothetical protein